MGSGEHVAGSVVGRNSGVSPFQKELVGSSSIRRVRLGGQLQGGIVNGSNSVAEGGVPRDRICTFAPWGGADLSLNRRGPGNAFPLACCRACKHRTPWSARARRHASTTHPPRARDAAQFAPPPTPKRARLAHVQGARARARREVDGRRPGETSIRLAIVHSMLSLLAFQRGLAHQNRCCDHACGQQRDVGAEEAHECHSEVRLAAPRLEDRGR